MREGRGWGAFSNGIRKEVTIGTKARGPLDNETKGPRRIRARKLYPELCYKDINVSSKVVPIPSHPIRNIPSSRQIMQPQQPHSPRTARTHAHHLGHSDDARRRRRRSTLTNRQINHASRHRVSRVVNHIPSVQNPE